MKEYWIEDFEVRYYQCDLNGYLSLQNLCHFLIETALYHAEDLGVSVEQLQQNNLTWMLSRLILEIDRLPARQEKITIKTWPSGARKLFSCRDFLIFDESGKEIARATTGWLVVDMIKRRPVRLPEYVLKIQNNSAQRVIERDFASFTSETEYCSESRFNVLNSDIDINNHVTAVSYIDWIINSIPLNFYAKKLICELEIEYRYEAVINESVHVYTSSDTSEQVNTLFHRVKNSSEDKMHAVAQTRWINHAIS